jgi:hypothetical protein
MTSASNGQTTPATDQVLDVLSRGQQTMTDAATGMARIWGAALSGADEATRHGAGPLPLTASLGDLVDQAGDTGVAVLEMQRSFAHQMLDAMRLR